MKLDDAPGKDDGIRTSGGTGRGHSHTRKVCEHGTTISNCRCAFAGKQVEVVRPCPFGAAHGGEPVIAGLGGSIRSEPAEGVVASSLEDVYRAATNRYFRNADFARRVDETVRDTFGVLAMTAAEEHQAKRAVLTSVTLALYRAGA